MTAFSASLPFPRPRRDRLPAGAAVISLVGHVVVALVVVLAAIAIGPSEQALRPEDRAVEVVMVPADEPAPDALVPPPDLLPLPIPPPPNIDETAPVTDRSVRPPAPAVLADTRPPTAEDTPTAPRPTVAPDTSAPQSDGDDVPQERAPSPPSQPVVLPRADVAALPLPQVARPQPAERPARPRGEQQPRAVPSADAPRGQLREIDLFGPGRLGPRQTAAARAGAPDPEPREASRSDSDFILAQILRRWRINYRDPRYRGLSFEPGTLLLKADGTLASPYGPRDPWNPYDMMNGYQILTRRGAEDWRRAVDTFLVALREAQPFELPPTAGPYPRRIRITFRMGDL